MEIIRLTETSVGAAAKKAAQALRAGQLIVYPSDTVYCFGVDAKNKEAIARMRMLKQRESKKPVTVIVPNIHSIHTYAEVPEHAKEMIQKFFPGPLTLILKMKHGISPEITLNGGVGIRYPKDLFCETLANVYGKPFTSAGANRSGRENPRTIQEVLEQFKHDTHEIGLVIDGGEQVSGVPSTVVSFLHEPPAIVRQGQLTREELGM